MKTDTLDTIDEDDLDDHLNTLATQSKDYDSYKSWLADMTKEGGELEGMYIPFGVHMEIIKRRHLTKVSFDQRAFQREWFDFRYGMK